MLNVDAAEQRVFGGQQVHRVLGAGGRQDGWVRLLQQPLDGLAIGLVVELAGELRDGNG
jgi:hypothetical protein